MRNIGIVLDIETTGLSATEDDIWEIAYLQIDLDTNEILESFSFTTELSSIDSPTVFENSTTADTIRPSLFSATKPQIILPPFSDSVLTSSA
jgi:DNA polymerase III alpha subunit (gram-positive type)